MDSETLVERWRDATGCTDLSEPSTQVSYRASAVTHWDGPPADPELPHSAGYTLEKEIGRGGMGIVYLARQESLHRQVAVKKLLTGSVDGRARSLSTRRFFSESLFNAGLEHPNIVPVHDLARTEGGDFILAMKLIGGRTWQDALQSPDAADLDAQLEILLQVCNAVAFAHSRGVVHCDLKPANVLVGDFGEVLLADWGLALEIGERQKGSLLPHKDDLHSPCGTPCYMAPELAEGEGSAIGPWTDVYLLGGILFRLVTGQPPHHGYRLVEILGRIARGIVPALSDEHPAELRALCRSALMSEPRERIRSVADFQQAVRGYLRHRESRTISRGAREKLAQCRAAAQLPRSRQQRDPLYESYAEAVADFAQALRLWPDNPQARAGGDEARLAFAEAALGFDDLVLADAQLARLRGQQTPAAGLQDLERRLAAKHSQRRRELRNRRLLKSGLAAMLVLVGIIVAVFVRADAQRTERMLAERRALIDERLAELQIADPGSLLGRAERASAHAEMEQLSEEERTQHAGLLDSLVVYLAWQEELLRLRTEVIGDGRHPPLIDEGQRRRDQGLIEELRRAAVRLAVANQAFDQALLLVNQGGGPAASLHGQRQRVEAARTRQLESQLAATEAALADLRQGFHREERPGWMPTSAEYVIQLAGYRHQRVVELLAARLDELSARASGEGSEARPVAWTDIEREELGVILDVLGAIQLPRFSLPPLQRFVQAVWDPKLAVRAALAVCSTRDRSAELPLVETLLLRFGIESEVWLQVSRFLGRFPAQHERRSLATAAAYHLRAVLLRYKGLLDDAIEDLGQAIELAPEEPVYRNERGLLYSKRGDLPEALVDFERAIELDPSYAQAYSLRGRVLARLDRWEAALKDLQRAVELAPAGMFVVANRGQLLASLEDWPAAHEAFDRAVELSPQAAGPHVGRALTRLALGDPEGALLDLERALRIDPRSVTAFRVRGLVYARTGQPGEALTALDRAIAVDPGYPLDYTNRGNLLYDMGQFERCLEDLGKAIELDPTVANTYNTRASALHELGRMEEALADFNSALELEPRFALALNNRGLLWSDLGRLEEASEDLSRAIESDPQDPSAYSNLAGVRARQGDVDAAEELYLQALTLAPGLVEAHVNLGWIRLRQGDPAGALQCFDTAVGLAPDFAESTFHRALFFFGQQQYAEALADLDRTVQSAPGLARAYALRADTQRALGRPELAVEDYGRAVAAAPGSARYHAQHAQLLTQLARFEQAVTAFSEAIALGPGYFALYANRASPLAALGRLEEALADAEKALELEPGRPELRSLRDSLRERLERRNEAP